MTTAVVRCPACGKRNRVPAASAGHPRCAACRSDLPWIVDAGDDDFRAAVGDGTNSPLLVLVDLWAPWCGPCRMVAPSLETLAREHAGALKVVKVDVDTSPQVARRYQAQSIPMLLVMRRGEVVDTVVGAQPLHVLRSLVARHL